MELDTDSLYFTSCRKVFIGVSGKKNGMSGNCCEEKILTISSLQMFAVFFFLVHVERNKKVYYRGEGALFKEELRYTELLCLCGKTYCCYDSRYRRYKFSSKVLNKRTFESHGDGPMAANRKVLEETQTLKSTNRGFRTENHSVVTCKQTKKGLFLSKEDSRSRRFPCTSVNDFVWCSKMHCVS